MLSFISAPGCLAVAVGLVTPLHPCPDDHVAPFNGLRRFFIHPANPIGATKQVQLTQ